MIWNEITTKYLYNLFDESILLLKLVTTVFICKRYTQKRKKMELERPKALQFQFVSTSLETVGLFICDSNGSSTVVCFLK